MLLLYPALTWIAPVTSGLFLVVHWREGGARRLYAAIGLVWFLLALYFQFLAHSVALAATGLALQTLLAVVLIVRWNAG